MCVTEGSVCMCACAMFAWAHVHGRSYHSCVSLLIVSVLDCSLPWVWLLLMFFICVCFCFTFIFIVCVFPSVYVEARRKLLGVDSLHRVDLGCSLTASLFTLSHAVDRSILFLRVSSWIWSSQLSYTGYPQRAGMLLLPSLPPSVGIADTHHSASLWCSHLCS